MKILFHNYANAFSTEPIYFHNALIKAGIDSVLWLSRATSAYDMFDTYQPDVFVTHFQVFSYDILDYFKHNKFCEIAMNVTGATQAQINSVEQTLSDANIKCPLLFTNNFSGVVNSKLNLQKIYPAADIFNMDFGPYKHAKVPEAIISDKFSEKVQNYIANKEVFHLLYLTGGDMDSNFDIRVNAQSVAQLYKFYPKVVLIGDNDLCCSQVFLDANLSCEKVEVQSSDIEGFQQMLTTMFSDVDEDVENIQAEIKSQIKSKHTPFDRAWRLMKYLKNEDGMNKIMSVKNELPELLRNV